MVMLHRDGHRQGRFVRNRNLRAAQHLPQTTDLHRSVTAGEGNHILDSATDFSGYRRKERNASRTNVSCLLYTVYAVITHLNNLQRQLKLVAVSASLFQRYYTNISEKVSQWRT